MRFKMMSYALAATLIVGIPLVGYSVNTTTTTTTTTDPTTTTELYSGPPVIQFSLSKQETPVITVNGLLPDNVEGITWNGVDISNLVNSLINNGTIQQTVRADGFDLAISIDIRQLAGKNEFGIIYSGNKLSTTMDSDALLASAQDRAFTDGFWVWGYVRYRNPSCWFWYCWGSAAGAQVALTVKQYASPLASIKAVADSNGYYTAKISSNAGCLSAVNISATGTYKGITKLGKTTLTSTILRCQQGTAGGKIDIDISQ